VGNRPVTNNGLAVRRQVPELGVRAAKPRAFPLTPRHHWRKREAVPGLSCSSLSDSLSEFGKAAQPQRGAVSPARRPDTDERAKERIVAALSCDDESLSAANAAGLRAAAIDFERDGGGWDPDGALYVGAPETVSRKNCSTQ
jgi:hypothetical protein